MNHFEELEFEIKQLKQHMSIMRSIIDKQQSKIMLYDRIFTDWLNEEKDKISKLLPTNKE